jgi:hypothetical protein
MEASARSAHPTCVTGPRTAGNRLLTLLDQEEPETKAAVAGELGAFRLIGIEMAHQGSDD